MTTYYKIIECTDPCYESGEIIARCEARDRRQAMRKFHMDENSTCECIPESRLPTNLYDPRLLCQIKVTTKERKKTMTTTLKKTHRLGSNSLVFAPGILRWAIGGYRFRKDRPKLRELMRSWPGLTDKQWHDVLSGKVPYTVDGDTVVITFEEETR
jgi:hypothetical protein